MVTTTTELIDTGEKRDRRGRRISSVERRAEAVTAWRGSGLTMGELERLAAASAPKQTITYERTVTKEKRVLKALCGWAAGRMRVVTSSRRRRSGQRPLNGSCG